MSPTSQIMGADEPSLVVPSIEGWFTENAGQMQPDTCLYYVMGKPLSVAFGVGWVAYYHHPEGGEGGAVYKMVFNDCRPVVPVGTDGLTHQSNYFLGSEPSQWHSGVGNFEGVLYRNLWGGIDLRFYMREGKLKYDIDVRPGSNPRDAMFNYLGLESISIDPDSGDLLLRTPIGTIMEDSPTAFQSVGEGSRAVDCEFTISDGSAVTFDLGGYDCTLPLTIDPGVVFSTLLSDGCDGWGWAICADEDGESYITGNVNYINFREFPTTPGAYDTTHNKYQDVYVTKLNSDGSSLVFSTFIGGAGYDFGRGIRTDDDENVYVTGATRSRNFPTTPDAYDRAHYSENQSYGTPSDVFLLKLSAAGDDLLYSTFIGGEKEDGAFGLHVEDGRWAYLVGSTHSAEFPTTADAFDREKGGDQDIFAVKFDISTSNLVYSTFIGGSHVGEGSGVDTAAGRLAVDAEGCAYLAGGTKSPDFPTTPGAYDTEHDSNDDRVNYDVFVLKLSADGSSLEYSTFIGGGKSDTARGIRIDDEGNAYVTGNTYSNPGFPVTSGAYNNTGESSVATFVLKLNTDGSGLLYSAMISGEGADYPSDLWVDGSGATHVVGTSYDPGFPTTNGSWDETFSGERDGFYFKLSEGGQDLLYSTFIGGGSDDYARGIWLDSEEFIYITGYTRSLDFKTTPGAFIRERDSSNEDPYVLKIPPGLNIPNPIELVGGSQVYSNYTNYDFKVDANPTGLDELPYKASIVLDPTGADVELAWRNCDCDDQFSVERDPEHLVTIDTYYGNADMNWFEWKGTLHFNVTFNWTWPHEDLCDVKVTLEWHSGRYATYIARDVFKVENDLAFVGSPVAIGQWQGPLEEDDWVRGGENLTLSGPILVYENTTDIHPRDGVVDLTLLDDDGDMVVASHGSGIPVKLTIGADITTDSDEVLKLSILEMPGTSQLRSEPTFRVRVDADRPLFIRHLPDGEDWLSSLDVDAVIVTTDNETSGIDADGIVYSVSMVGLTGYLDWTAEGLVVKEVSNGIRGQVRVRLPEGEDNYIRWLVRDMVGNEATLSDLRVRIDTVNVTFSDPIPVGWQTSRQVSCGVTIHDTDGSGISVTTVQYRTSYEGLSGYGPWTAWYGGLQGDARTIVVRVLEEFPETNDSYIQWRAADIAGNGLTGSPHYLVLVDLTFIEFDLLSPSEDNVQDNSQVSCEVVVWDDPGGSGVYLTSIEFRYRPTRGAWSDWTSLRLEGGSMREELMLTLTFPDGFDNVFQLRGYDVAGNGPTISREFLVKVDDTGPEFVEVNPDPLEKQRDTVVDVSVSLRDALSGLDPALVSFRHGTDGNQSLGDWSSLEVLQTIDGIYTGTIKLDLVPGRTNVVEFMAFDLAGNVAMFGPFHVWINRPPDAWISQPVDGDSFSGLETIALNASGTTDPDGDVLNYTWTIEGSESPVGHESLVVIHLLPGIHNITLVVMDDQGAEDRRSVQVTVERQLPPTTASMDEHWLLLAFLIIAVVVLIMVYIMRTRSRSEG